MPAEPGPLVPEITAHVPAAPEHVHVLRAVLAGVAAKEGASVDDVADLRLIVDEAAAVLLGTAPGASILTLDVTLVSDGLEAVLGVDAHGTSVPDVGVGWRILRTLAEEAEMIDLPAGPAIRFFRRFGAA